MRSVICVGKTLEERRGPCGYILIFFHVLEPSSCLNSCFISSTENFNSPSVAFIAPFEVGWWQVVIRMIIAKLQWCAVLLWRPKKSDLFVTLLGQGCLSSSVTDILKGSESCYAWVTCPFDSSTQFPSSSFYSNVCIWGWCWVIWFVCGFFSTATGELIFQERGWRFIKCHVYWVDYLWIWNTHNCIHAMIVTTKEYNRDCFCMDFGFCFVLYTKDAHPNTWRCLKPGFSLASFSYGLHPSPECCNLFFT